MKTGKLKSLLLALAALLLIGLLSVFLLKKKSSASDLLEDPAKSNSELLIELKDTYQAFHINNIIVEQKEMINLLLNDGSDAAMKGVLDSYMEVCDSLKAVPIKNDILGSYIRNYLDLTIQSYEIAQNSGFSSSEFKDDFETYKKERDEYMYYLYSTYSLDHFISMTEEEYWQTIDKDNYIKSPDYDKYMNLKETDLEGAMDILEKLTKQTTNFQEYSIYQIELADQYVKHANSLGDDAHEIAISKYKEILDQKKFSIYLFEAWLKWRMVSQQFVYGSSKTSTIPNNLYDEVREKVALTILDYITKNEKDEMAINEFLILATHPIVMRFGDYPYGNQSALEFHQTFEN